MIEELKDFFEDRLKDGFQPDDLLATVEHGVRLLVRAAADKVPGATGKEKTAWIKNQLYTVVDELGDEARKAFSTGVLFWAGYLIEEVVERAGRAAVDWLVENTIEAVIKWAYGEEVLHGNIISDSFMAKVAAA